MTDPKLEIVFLGLTITSTWGNGHATTYRGLLKELHRAGHRVTFLERDMPWYASHREFETVPYARIHLYNGLEELRSTYSALIRQADVVIVGSYVVDGIDVGEWVTSIAGGVCAFYDIDTPVTLAALQNQSCAYLSRKLCRQYHLYLSFTGGPTLRYIEKHFGSPRAYPLYCSVDAELYYPEKATPELDLAYLGTYAPDRQPALKRLLLQVAHHEPDRKFAVAGPQYPLDICWPNNVERIDHVSASEHRRFYNTQRYTLNLTRADMVKAGYSPSVRLFEAAACGTPIISDIWPGLDEIFNPNSEILLASNTSDVLQHLRKPKAERDEIGERARQRTLRLHTATQRSTELSTYVTATLQVVARSKRRGHVFLKPSEAVVPL